jgi:D-alanyl-D-alanine carboxypeptidase
VADPTEIGSLAVTGEDLVAAVETNRTTGREAVLRVTPPFSGRMRARLHLVQSAGTPTAPRPVHVDPDALLEPDAPTYPRPADTEDALRESGETYTVDRHREYHADAVAAWRERLRGAVRNRATIRTPAGPTEVDVHVLD